MACRHDPASVIARQPIFRSLTMDECHALVRRSVCRAVRRSENLFREGEPCRGLYLVVEGAVRLYRANRNGQEQVLRLARAGDSLGEVAVFDEGPYLASARATEDGRVLFLEFAEVHALYRTHPEIAQAVVRDLGRRVRGLVALVDRLALHDVPARVASAILEYASGEGATSDGDTFQLPRTQEQLAAEIGASRETVARALGRLKREGAIEQKGARIRLLSTNRLRSLTDGLAPLPPP
jgi:CRP-like cAMP-binding protein